MGNDTWYCYNDLPTAGQSTGPTGLCYIPTVPALPAHSPADATLSPSTPATWTSVQDARGNITRRGYWKLFVLESDRHGLARAYQDWLLYAGLRVSN